MFVKIPSHLCTESTILRRISYIYNRDRSSLPYDDCHTCTDAQWAGPLDPKLSNGSVTTDLPDPSLIGLSVRFAWGFCTG